MLAHGMHIRWHESRQVAIGHWANLPALSYPVRNFIEHWRHT